MYSLRTGETLARFTGEDPVMACGVTPDGRTYITGDQGGQVNVLRLENVHPSLPVVTARQADAEEIAVQCLLCSTWTALQVSDLGNVVRCRSCGTQLRVSPFSVDGHRDAVG